MNSWIQHVKQVQREHGISYKDALKVASQSYNGGSIASEKVRRFIYKKGFNPAKLKNPSKFISDGKYVKAKQTKSTKRKKDLEAYEEEVERLRNINYGKGVYSKGLIYDPNIDYSKYFIKGMPNPKSKGGGAFLNPLIGKVKLKNGGKIRGKGFWDNVLKTVDKVGNTAGNVVSSALGKEMGGIPLPNPYSMGRDLGENYIGPALRKQIKGY